MKITKTIHSKHFLLYVDIGFIVLAFFYFYFFVNKGLVLSDEGYYVHYAERITRGEIPYKDFVLQYTPGYFYLLAFLYKIFGVQILVGRFISLFACLGILISVFVLLRLYKITSVRIHILVALSIIFLTYPLLHIPLVIWICVLLSLQMVIVYIHWLRKRSYRYAILLGTLIAFTILIRQHIGAVFMILINILILVSDKKQRENIVVSLGIINITWLTIISLFIAFYYSIAGNLSGILTIFALSKHFVDTYQFSYPSLMYLFQPTGLFKLLPYYFPIIFLLFVIWSILKKRVNLDVLAFALITLSGFFATVYPASDLLHVYPFLAVCLVSSCVFFYKRKAFPIFYVLLPLFILIGIYLTFVGQSYRYEGYFLKETTPLTLPRTAGIFIDNTNTTMTSLVPLYNFIQQHTQPSEYIFVYPFSPMLYYVFDRKNPNGIVQYVLFDAGSLYPEERVLREMKQKHVKYIIAVGPYINDKKISKFIQQQKKVYKTGPYIVFEIKK